MVPGTSLTSLNQQIKCLDLLNKVHYVFQVGILAVVVLAQLWLQGDFLK